jgi:hypothetical protein
VVNTNPIVTPPPQLSTRLSNEGSGVHDFFHNLSAGVVVIGVVVIILLIGCAWLAWDSLKNRS